MKVIRDPIPQSTWLTVLKMKTRIVIYTEYKACPPPKNKNWKFDSFSAIFRLKWDFP